MQERIEIGPADRLDLATPETCQDPNISIIASIVRRMQFVHGKKPYPQIDPSSLFARRIEVPGQPPYYAIGLELALDTLTVGGVRDEDGNVVFGIQAEHGRYIPPRDFFAFEETISHYEDREGVFVVSSGGIGILNKDLSLSWSMYHSGEVPAIQCVFIDLSGSLAIQDKGYRGGLGGLAVAQSQATG